MLGNDIVDLTKARFESNWKRKGYLAKIFTPEEQTYIHNASSPDQMIWQLWSMKEAAYKIVNRENLQRFNNPLKFNCKNIFFGHENVGFVKFEDKTFSTKSVIKENFIHTIACSKAEMLPNILTSFLCNTSNYIAEFNSKSPSHFLEKNTDGIPHLLNKTNGKHYFASISHHGEYLAIIYSPNLAF